MRIKKLIKDLEITIYNSRDVVINGISSDSRLLAPGNLFIAKKGQSVDGFRFIPDAIAAGAAAILSDYYDPSLKGIVQLVHPDVQKMEAVLAARYYEHPSKKISTVGITGTNGKTTTSWMIREILEKHQTPCGMIGTLGYYVGGEQVYDATHTTPEVTRMHKLLREMCRHGCKVAVMEATSHALDQGRLQEIAFDIAVFTNLTHDHLDYHGDFTHYKKAKSTLFTNLEKQNTIAIVNGDDPSYKEITSKCPAKILLYGFGQQCDLQATDFILTDSGTQFSLLWQGKKISVHSPFIGKHNIYNSLAAIATVLHLDVPLSDAVSIFPSLTQIPGRMERISSNALFSIIVDFAHTPNALESVTEIAKKISKGKLITLFGCGGDRDKTKRPLMAKAAEKYSDLCIVTSDNPRTENPQEICDQILSGFSSRKEIHCIVDRKEAISFALKKACPGDTILLAGKGHECTQLIGRQSFPFNDKSIALEILQKTYTGAV